MKENGVTESDTRGFLGVFCLSRLVFRVESTRDVEDLLGIVEGGRQLLEKIHIKLVCRRKKLLIMMLDFSTGNISTLFATTRL